MSSLTNVPVYTFYNKDWYIAAEVVKQFNLSSSYNTYYSKYFSNGRLLGPTKSYEFRLSGTYLEEFKRLYGANNASLSKSSAVWLIDSESALKLINRTQTTEKNIITVESNKLSIEYNLGSIEKDNTIDSKSLFGVPSTAVFPSVAVLPSPPQTYKEFKEEYETKNSPYYRNKSSYSEEEISDAITLLSSKLTTNPYQQEKLLNSSSIRIDLFCSTRRNITAVELKNHTITLQEVKEKIEDKQYLNHLIKEFPNLPITFIFSGPSGIDLDAFLYLQQTSKSISPHKLIYKPVSNLLLDMINKREKDLPSYYYEQIISKPVIKSLLELE
jgi:hypothetical protein